MSDVPATRVGFTAKVMAAGRAIESRRPDRLFIDLHSSDEWAKYWQSSCDDPESFFHAYGWKASALQPGEEGASYGRFTFQFTDRTIKEAPHIFFLTASKQA